MKNKKIIIIILAMIIIAVIICVIVCTFISSDKKDKASKILGEEYCTEDHSMEVGGMALTQWKCKVCGRTQTNSSTNIPVLCDKCAFLTGRCGQCGKIKK